jgi:integrase
MAYIGKLPSGKWQAQVRLPTGKRVTRSHTLKRVVQDWAAVLEDEIARGRWADPRSGRLTYTEWSERFMASRTVEKSTLRGDETMMRTHILPFFGHQAVASIRPTTVKAWLAKMARDGVGPAAQVRAYALFRTSMNAAVADEIIVASPAAKVPAPKTTRKQVQWFSPDQVDTICSHLGSRDTGMVLVMAWCGLRWGEAAGLRVQDVDWLARRVSVVQVVTQEGKIKAYPKNSTSRRDIPAPPMVLEALSPLAAGKDRGDLLFTTASSGRPLSGSNWRKEMWYPAVKKAKVPSYPPHALRHTAASWLVQAGVSLVEVQRLLGHSTPTMTNRYAHLAPGAHSAVENAWAAMTRAPQSEAR